MRKLAFSTLIFALTINTLSYSQNPGDAAKVDLPGFTGLPDLSDVTPDARIPALNEVSSKALRDFKRNHKNIAEVKWFQSSTGFIAVFVTDGGIKSFNYYDDNGGFEYMLRYYKEEKLPKDVRHLVKSRYYDFDIYQVTEVTRNDKQAYVIKLQDKDHWKTIKVADNEIQILDEFLKVDTAK